MNAENKKELINLLSRFFSPTDIEQAYNDIASADDFFNSSNIDGPSDTVIKAIKQHMATSLKKSAHRRKVGYEIAALAAGLMILALVSIKFITPHTQNSQLAASVINYGDVWDYTDIELNVLGAQADQIETSLSTIESSENFDFDGSVLNELKQTNPIILKG